jgi:nucleoid-associated protein EbfC
MFESQLAKVSENVTQALEELETTELEGSSGGGVVRVRITGTGQVLSVTISPSIVNAEDLELLQDLVCAAVRDAVAKSTQTRKERLVQATPFGALGVDMPDII